jgi:hypothetical protein
MNRGSLSALLQFSGSDFVCSISPHPCENTNSKFKPYKITILMIWVTAGLMRNISTCILTKSVILFLYVYCDLKFKTQSNDLEKMWQ